MVRRGIPALIVSDNTTTFKGMQKQHAHLFIIHREEKKCKTTKLSGLLIWKELPGGVGSG